MDLDIPACNECGTCRFLERTANETESETERAEALALRDRLQEHPCPRIKLSAEIKVCVKKARPHKSEVCMKRARPHPGPNLGLAPLLRGEGEVVSASGQKEGIGLEPLSDLGARSRVSCDAEAGLQNP